MSAKERGFTEITTLSSRLQGTLGRWKNFSEWDTIIGFFVPMLQALGWNPIREAGGEVHFHGYAIRDNVHMGLPDCVLYLNNRAYAVFELKPLSYGTIGKDPAVLARLHEYCDNLGCRLQVLSRLYQTTIYDHQKNPVLEISDPSEYIGKFDRLWDLLSREKSASRAALHSARMR